MDITETNNYIRGRYYPHIDGLRAFAILPVLLYHAFPSLFPGGFIGVDVFFVISGYLITKGLLTDLESGKYSIGTFYVRRIRRIFPAYAAVILFSLLVVAFAYYGEKLKILAKTALSSTYFATNIYFEKTADYFAPASHTNPLLNLWSLSVEEQFYVFFPLLLAFLFKWAPRHLKWVVWIVSIASLLLSVWAVNFSNHDSMAFYLLPFRAWELMAGSLLAIYIKDNFINLRVGGLGLLVLVSCTFWMSSSQPFPGGLALVPILCAVVLLMSGRYGVSKKIMENGALVFIGKISYSLYLFHWPLLVFCRYMLWGCLEPLAINLIAITLSFLFSILSWRYIELPLRRTKWPKWRYFALAGGIIALTIAAAHGVRSLGKYEERHSEVVVEDYWDGQAANEEKYPDPHWPDSENRTPHSLSVLGQDANPQYVLWGDSHAMALSPAFHVFSIETGINGLYINRKHILMCWANSRIYPDNDRWIEEVLQWLEKHPELRTVVLHNRWAVRSQGYANEMENQLMGMQADEQIRRAAEAFERGITELCKRLQAMGKNVVILTSVPEQMVEVPEMLQRYNLFSSPRGMTCMSHAAYSERQREANAVFKKLENQGLARIISVEKKFYPGNKPCELLLPGNISMYKDDDHLTPSGAKWLIHQMEKPLRDAILAH